MTVLRSKPALGLGILSIAYLSCQEFTSIPFRRAILNIKEIQKEKKTLLLHNKLLEINETCLNGIIFENIKSIEGGEAKLREIRRKLQALEYSELITLLYPEKNKIRKNRRLGTEQLVALQDLDGDEDKLNDCILQRILKMVDKENLDFFDIDTILLNLDYIVKLIPNIVELLSILIFGSFAFKK